MRIAMIGLGKMGSNMASRLIAAGHQVVVFDINADAVAGAAASGGIAADSLEAVKELLDPPRAAWVMVPAGKPTDSTIARLGSLFEDGDIVIDGGNSNYKDSIRRGKELEPRGIHFVDVGTSGGVWGLEEGYSMMIGGSADAVAHLSSVFETLAPAADRGWGRVGEIGAGHFVKMVHNGIEYGLMQAYAEGFAILEEKPDYPFDLDAIANIWREGSVIRSWLLDLTAQALEENPKLDGIAPFVPDSGEGRWTVAEAIELDVSAPVITLALLNRLRSREDDSFADKLLSAMRNKFGGHSIRKVDG